MCKIITLSRENIELSVAIFEVDNPKICLQIVHGAKEHKERYFEFAEFLVQHGITVVVSDNRGHGASINENYPLGHMENWQEIIDDLHEVTVYTKSKFPKAKVYLLGHSLGSVFARCYIQKHDEEIAGLILSGTANYINVVSVGRIIAKCITNVFGTNTHTQLLTKLGDGNSDDGWVCANPNIMQAYRNDPLCTGYKYTNGAIRTIWEADYELHQFHNFQ